MRTHKMRVLPAAMGIGLALFFLGGAAFSDFSPSAAAEIPGSFFEKTRVTIAVTDSGLGGMGVLADAAARMETAGIFEHANFVFFNALFSNEGGYNALPSTEEKVRVFDNALEALARVVCPDLILIGCNTLSVIYPQTAFARKTEIPVLGIVEAGQTLMADCLRPPPRASLFI